MGSFLVALAAVSRQELVGLALGAVGAGRRRAAGAAVRGGQSGWPQEKQVTPLRTCWFGPRACWFDPDAGE